MSSSLLIPSAENAEITPAMLAVLWCVADKLDGMHLPANPESVVWLEFPARQLRDPDGRDDNFWLKKCLYRLTGMKLAGEYRGDAWGAVILGAMGNQGRRLYHPPVDLSCRYSGDLRPSNLCQD